MAVKPDADVGPVSPDLLAEVLADPAAFLKGAAEATPGWASRYGGPLGVAQVATALHEHLNRMALDCADVRVAAVKRLRTPPEQHTLASIGAVLGIGVPAVKKLADRPAEGHRITEILQQNPQAWD